MVRGKLLVAGEAGGDLTWQAAADWARYATGALIWEMRRLIDAGDQARTTHKAPRPRVSLAATHPRSSRQKPAWCFR